MSRASNSLKTSDVLTTPIKLKYTSSFESGSTEEVGIRILTGVNGSISTTGSIPEETLLYRSIKHLYYSNYLTSSIQVSASYTDNWPQSTAASGTLEADQRLFPTESGATIKIISIPRERYGEKISRKSFLLETKAYSIVDDGNGNLWDTYGIPDYIEQLYYINSDEYYKKIGIYGTHVGNIIYAQGFAIITNNNYQYIFPKQIITLTLIPDLILPTQINITITSTAPLPVDVEIDYEITTDTGAVTTTSTMVAGSTTGLFSTTPPAPSTAVTAAQILYITPPGVGEVAFEG